MKLVQIGSSIMNKLRGGFQVDDNRIDWQLVYDEIHKQRGIAMWQDFQQHKVIDESFYQRVSCLKPVCRPIVCDGIDSGDSELVVTLPKLMLLGDYALIRYFGTVDLQNPFTYTNVLGSIYKKADVYGGNSTFYSRIADEAIIRNPPTCGLEYVGLVAVLDNPTLTGCKKDYLEEEYPLPNRMVAHVEALCINALQRLLMIDPEQPNNAKDEVNGMPRPNNRNR